MLATGSEAATAAVGVIDRHGLAWRATEVVVAAAGLLVLSPLLLVIALAIFTQDGGSVLFVQRRVGRHGRTFPILKFRSMLAAEGTAGPAEDLRQPIDDVRLTPIGRVLRRSHLDELPQLLNVILGHMSLVGPRPLVPEHDALVTLAWAERHLHRPGMTGAWQVYRSSARSVEELVALDRAYLAQWSPGRDLQLMATTMRCVLKRSGI